MNLKDLIFDLSVSAGVSGLSGALDTAEKALREYADVRRTDGSLIGVLGDGTRKILLDAHIDEIGMIVTSTDDKGFVKVAKAGGLDLRILAAKEVTIWGAKPIPGVFCSTPPHLKGDKGDEVPEISDLSIDTGLSSEEVSCLIKPGDRVTFLKTPAELLGGYITGKSLDNRAGVAALIETARILKTAEKSGQAGDFEVTILLSDQEELGCRGARTAAFRITPDEAIAVDVSFGDSPNVPPHKTGKLSGGAMLGYSPVLSQQITERLARVAENKAIPYQPEVMGGATSTNADVIALVKAGVPCGLVSIPLRNMHTTAEVICIEDVKSVANLLASYVLSFTEQTAH